jgi:diguanylate cyclase (GGDEF)-like protein
LVTVISRFRVRNGRQDEVRRAFVNRPRLVEKAAGFRGLEVLTDAADPSVFLLLTRWTDEASFRAWHHSEAHHRSHELIPEGLKLDSSFTSLTIANSVDDQAGVQTIIDALREHPPELAQWVTESDAVLALLMAPDGEIRERNPAGHRIFPADPAGKFGLSIWDYAKCSDTHPLRQRLAGGRYDGSLRLNLAFGERDPITLEVALLPCRGATLLLGTEENRHDAHFQDELLKLTNDLSVMMRESGRNNRELKRANETIAQLARTDALTGLANHRTLHEALDREIARAGRLGLALSLIFADLDHFKSINDRYGHLVGDQVLVRAAAVFGSQSRPYDLPARYGGEEFVLVLPGARRDDAIGVAERIRTAVEHIEIPGCDGPITVSLGVAGWIAGEASDAFLARADAALYNAKSAGRNRVEAASEVHA